MDFEDFVWYRRSMGSDDSIRADFWDRLNSCMSTAKKAAGYDWDGKYSPVVSTFLESLMRDLQEYHTIVKKWREGENWPRLLKEEASGYTSGMLYNMALEEMQGFLLREYTVTTFDRSKYGSSTVYRSRIAPELEEKVSRLEGASTFVATFYEQQITLAEEVLSQLQAGKQEWGEEEFA